jgi:hypothetical protein
MAKRGGYAGLADPAIKARFADLGAPQRATTDLQRATAQEPPLTTPATATRGRGCLRETSPIMPSDWSTPVGWKNCAESGPLQVLVNVELPAILTSTVASDDVDIRLLDGDAPAGTLLGLVHRLKLLVGMPRNGGQGEHCGQHGKPKWHLVSGRRRHRILPDSPPRLMPSPGGCTCQVSIPLHVPREARHAHSFAYWHNLARCRYRGFVAVAHDRSWPNAAPHHSSGFQAMRTA